MKLCISDLQLNQLKFCNKMKKRESERNKFFKTSIIFYTIDCLKKKVSAQRHAKTISKLLKSKISCHLIQMKSKKYNKINRIMRLIYKTHKVIKLIKIKIKVKSHKLFKINARQFHKQIMINTTKKQIMIGIQEIRLLKILFYLN